MNWHFSEILEQSLLYDIYAFKNALHAYLNKTLSKLSVWH